MPCRSSSPTAAATASGPSAGAALVVVERGCHAAVQRVRRGQLDATDDGQGQQHRAARARAAVDEPRPAPRSVSMSSSAEAVMSVAPARSPGAQPGDVGLAGSRTSTGWGTWAASSRSASRSCRTQCCGPGSARREPAAHRAGAAAEVVDHMRAPPGGARPGRWRAPRRQPARAGRATRALTRVIARPGQHLGDHGRGGRPPGTATRAARGRPGAAASAARRRSARPAARRRVPPGHPACDEQPRAAERLAHAADVGRDDRHAAGQRLGDDHAVRLGPRRQHQQVRGGVAAVELGAGPRSR